MNTRFWDQPGKNKKFLVIYLCFDNIVLIFSIIFLDDNFVHAGTSVRERRERRERRRRRAQDNSKKFFINTLIFIILLL